VSYTGRKWLFLLLLPILLTVTWRQLRIETDLNLFFTTTGDEDTALLAGFLESGELTRRYLLMVEPRAASAASVDDASVGSFASSLAHRLAGLDAVERVWPANQPPQSWIEAVQTYAPRHTQIYSLDPRAERDTLFDPARLRERAKHLQQALLSPQGGFVKPIAKQDPLLLSLHGFRRMQGQLEKAARADPDHAGLILESRAASLDAEVQEGLQSAIRRQFESLNAASGGAFQLGMTGIPVFTVAAHREISRDITLVSTLSTVGVALVFLLMFRSFAALHWMFLIQMASFAVGALTTALVFGQIHSLTLALGASLIGICTDYPIHVLVHCAKHRGMLPGAAARLLWPSLVMGGLTTIIGYCALGTTGFPGLEQIAVFAVGGIAASLGLTRWILPALLVSTPLHPAHLPGLHAWIDFCRRRRAFLLVLLATSVVASVLLLPRMRWMEDLQNLMLDMSELKRHDQAIRSHVTSIEPGRFVLIQAQDMETALQRSEAAEHRLDSLKGSGALDEYHGLFPWLVSQRLQQENAETYRQALSPAFQEAWRAALADAGLSVEKLGRLSPATGYALRPEEVLASEVRNILSGQIVEQPGQIALALWLGRHDPIMVAEGLKGLEGVRYFSQRDLLNRMAQQYRDRALAMLGYGVLLMALLIWLRERSAVKVLLTLLPSLASSLFIFAIWAVLKQEVSFLHVIGLLLSFSLCVDYGIFFMDNRGRDTGITYHAIAASTLTTIASFGALGLAKTPSLPVLSVSVTLGVTLGFLLCPLLISPGPAKLSTQSPLSPGDMSSGIGDETHPK
jgi:predicted exporter